MPEQNLKCPFCPVTSSHGAGLASHIRSAHSQQSAGWSKARKSVAVHRGTPANSVSGGGFSGIVASLERQRDAIDSAIAALRAASGAAAPVQRKRGRPRKNG